VLSLYIWDLNMNQRFECTWKPSPVSKSSIEMR
jgi:hypothetical protein